MLVYAPEVREALDAGRPVVALETSVVAQGLPRPANLEAARECERVLRAADVVPATLAVIDGEIRIGLAEADLSLLAAGNGIEKAGARDLGRAVATGSIMSTTVGACLAIARAAGISVFATGGIGGVHRRAEITGDVSNDLAMLANSPVITVCAGAKSILDVPRTLEYLESLGVAVLGYGTDRFPAFYAMDSGSSVERVDDPRVIAKTLRAQLAIDYRCGIVVANPPPEQMAMESSAIGALVDSALSEADRQRVHGKDVTPFLLSYIAVATGGRSVDLNVRLLVSNARVAGAIAKALASLSPVQS